MVKVASLAQYQTVAAVIEACRYETGLTQTQLAQRMGATQKFVSLIETGKRPPTTGEEKAARQEFPLTDVRLGPFGCRE